MEGNQQSLKEVYLKEFKLNNDLKKIGYNIDNTIGEEICSLIKSKEITYDEAYASLQYAYNKLKLESNFVQIQ